MKKEISILVFILILVGCAGKNNAPAPAAPVIIPGKTLLITPAQNSICITGSVLSDVESSVVFTWNASDNTDNYDVYLTNLLTGNTTVQNTTQTTLTITLNRNTPYSWYVESKSAKSDKTTKSDIWKFYNSGPGLITYAPFPAEIIAPSFGQNLSASGIVKLSWIGSTVSQDTVANYDVYFGTTSSPLIFKSALTDNFIDNVAVSSNSTYYWHVVTRDKNGNTSDSGLYQFSVN
jgi:hypothetical protein